MGYRMAGNVRTKMDPTSTLHVLDIDKSVCDRFINEFGSFGPIKIGKSAKDIAQSSSTIISMLPMDKHVSSVYLDPVNGIIAAEPNPNRLALECSTISVSTAQAVGKEIMDAGVAHYVDTPVSGGIMGAGAGTLSFFCGYAGPADRDDMTKRIKSILDYMGASERINFCGKLGNGLVSKIVNNYIGLSNLVIASEGLSFGLRHGVDIHTLQQCIKGSSGDSWILNNTSPAPGAIPKSPASNGFRPGFTNALCIKDLTLGVEAAKEVGIPTKMGELAIARYKQSQDDPRTSGLDCSSVWLHINDQVDAFANSQPNGH
ncbi:hypothetical protein PV10_01713 [Exophiala mesophila]|uniref:3-hydroxyisobutyrate dehydrogenase n=1 Tax=Exophiala mesophila TaxID=212818 RepID=A0A0D1X805_EXOME|nr:uncharacterized protein PV10_01713 [Exophiala mesophila]KIV98020.1 hypothetical protein PV10_01713 [Exophiala mesophila]